MWILDKVAGDENFPKSILFDDEYTFHNNETANRHNFHYCSDFNLYQIRIIHN